MVQFETKVRWVLEFGGVVVFLSVPSDNWTRTYPKTRSKKDPCDEVGCRVCSVGLDLCRKFWVSGLPAPWPTVFEFMVQVEGLGVRLCFRVRGGGV